MRTIRILTIFTFLASPCLADDKSMPTRWFGNVNYSHTIEASCGNKDKSYKAQQDCTRNTNIWTYIHFCVDGPARVTHAAGQAVYLDETGEIRKYNSPHEWCPAKKIPGKRQKTVKVSPGDSEDSSLKKSTKAIQDGKTGYNDWAVYRVGWMPGSGPLHFGIITVTADMRIRMEHKETISGTHACTGKPLKDNPDPKPMTMDTKLGVMVNLDEPKMFYSGREVLKNISTKKMGKCVCSTWNRLSRGKLESSYTEKEIRSWLLTSDECAYVKSQMDNVKKLEGIFNKLANGTAKPTSMTSMLNQAGGGSTFAPIRTDGNTCKVLPHEKDHFRSLEDVRQRYYKCLPDVVFEADIIHEGVHQKSCASKHYNNCSLKGTGKSGEKTVGDCKVKGNYAALLNDPVARANEEIPAYQAQYNHLENWYNKNCKGK